MCISYITVNIIKMILCLIYCLCSYFFLVHVIVFVPLSPLLPSSSPRNAADATDVLFIFGPGFKVRNLLKCFSSCVGWLINDCLEKREQGTLWHTQCH